MSRDKAEPISQRKTKISNGSTSQRTTSKTKEEIKKAREPSTDRSNIKKTISRSSIKDKKLETVNSKSKPKDVVTKTTKPNDVVTKTTKPTPRITTDRTISKITSKTSTIDKKINSTPRTVSKPLKASNISSSLTSSKNGTKLSSRDITSHRVTKEQYYPKKYPFSSYLHENEPPKHEVKKPEKTTRTLKPKTKEKQEEKRNKEGPKKLSRERTMTRILSPSEIKVVKNIVQDSETELSIKDDERPRTATIRKHNDTLETNEATSLDASSLSIQTTESVNSEENHNDYEDDFESYESDFEECSSSSSTSEASSNMSIVTDSTSSESSSEEEKITELTQKRTNSAGNEEERKLDSGNYDLPDKQHKQILDKIKEAIEKENSDLAHHILKNESSNLGSLSDEGFEDGSKYSNFNNGFINFNDARKKQQMKKLNKKSRKRGDDLMNMIRLNSVYFSLFDQKSITYEAFMQSYGRSGTIQMSAQTGDDNLDEEIQTDTINLTDKSTQFPIRFSKTDETDKNISDSNLDYNNHNLNKFLLKSGRLILNILERKQTKNEQIIKNQQEIPFSNGYVQINYGNMNFLQNRKVTCLAYSKQSNLLTVHENNLQVYMNENEQLLARAIICVWSLLESDTPHYILASSGDITKACFDCNHGYLVFAGIKDGSVSVWDLRESKELHRSVYNEESDSFFTMRTPTYTTVSTIDTEPSTIKIIAIQSYNSEHIDNAFVNDNKHSISGTQLCTLDEQGTVIIWSIIERQVTAELLSEDQGLVPWGCIVLVQGLIVSLQKLNTNLNELECYDLQFHATEPNHLFIASNYGILHCLTSGMKPKPKLYSSADKTSTNCVEMSPFSPIHFLTGCENGNIKLHSRFYEKQLMTLCSVEEENKIDVRIDIIEWSNSRPCVFFIKDSLNFIHIWDLSASDIYPIYSIPFNEEISDIKLSPILNGKDQLSYLAIASREHGIRLHILSKEFCNLSSEQHKNELKIFLNYANRL